MQLKNISDKIFLVLDKLHVSIFLNLKKCSLHKKIQFDFLNSTICFWYHSVVADIETNPTLYKLIRNNVISNYNESNYNEKYNIHSTLSQNWVDILSVCASHRLHQLYCMYLGNSRYYKCHLLLRKSSEVGHFMWIGWKHSHIKLPLILRFLLQ